jgi:hypothetical protein
VRTTDEVGIPGTIGRVRGGVRDAKAYVPLRRLRVMTQKT